MPIFELSEAENYVFKKSPSTSSIWKDMYTAVHNVRQEK